jgi:hypothetical protein
MGKLAGFGYIKYLDVKIKAINSKNFNWRIITIKNKEVS